MGFRVPKTDGERFGAAMAAFLCGIAAHALFPKTRFGVEAWLVATLCFVATFPLIRRRSVFWIWMVLAAFFVGAYRFDVTVPRENDGVLAWMGRTVRIEGIVRDVRLSRMSETVVVDVRAAAGVPIRGPARRLRLRTKDATDIGARVAFSCVLREPVRFPSRIPAWMLSARKGIWAECSGTVRFDASSPRAWSWDAFFARRRRILTERIQQVLPPEEAGLLAGILYGDEDLSPELEESFRRAGLMHIVAVSGSNVTIVVGILLLLALRAGVHRRRAFWIISLGLLCFVGFVGASSSVVRAACMGWLILFARHAGRIPWTDRLLLSAACAISLVNPWLLLFDPGFALSFLATWGLLVWAPSFERFFRHIPAAFGLRSALAATSAASLMTMPYIAWLFGDLPLAGLVTNAFVVPLIPWTMLWGALAAVWGDLAGHVAAALPATGLLRLIIAVARFADRVPWLDVRLDAYDAWMMGATYVTLWVLWRALWGNFYPHADVRSDSSVSVR